MEGLVGPEGECHAIVCCRGLLSAQRSDTRASVHNRNSLHTADVLTDDEAGDSRTVCGIVEQGTIDEDGLPHAEKLTATLRRIWSLVKGEKLLIASASCFMVSISIVCRY